MTGLDIYCENTVILWVIWMLVTFFLIAFDSHSRAYPRGKREKRQQPRMGWGSGDDGLTWWGHTSPRDTSTQAHSRALGPVGVHTPNPTWHHQSWWSGEGTEDKTLGVKTVDSDKPGVDQPALTRFISCINCWEACALSLSFPISNGDTDRLQVVGKMLRAHSVWRT